MTIKLQLYQCQPLFSPLSLKHHQTAVSTYTGFKPRISFPFAFGFIILLKLYLNCISKGLALPTKFCHLQVCQNALGDQLHHQKKHHQKNRPLSAEHIATKHGVLRLHCPSHFFKEKKKKRNSFFSMTERTFLHKMGRDPQNTRNCSKSLSAQNFPNPSNKESFM